MLPSKAGSALGLLLLALLVTAQADNSTDNSKTCTSLPEPKASGGWVWVDDLVGFCANFAWWWLIVVLSYGAGGTFILAVHRLYRRVRGLDANDDIEDVYIPYFSVLTGYLGFIYLLYMITLPLFGKPFETSKNGGNDEDLGDRWLFPNPPHFCPCGNKDGFTEAQGRMVINAIALGFTPFVFASAFIISFGLIIVLPFTLVLLTLLFALAMVAEKAYMTNRKLHDDEEEPDLQKKKEEQQKENLQGQPKWTEASPMFTPGACLLFGFASVPECVTCGAPDCGSCVEVACHCGAPRAPGLGCCSFQNLQLFVDFWMELFGFAFAVTFKFGLDILLLFSVMDMFFEIELPTWQIFNIKFSAPELPCLRIKLIWTSCVSYALLNTLLILFASAFSICVIVMSDVITMLSDRVDRNKKLKKTTKRSRFIGAILEMTAALTLFIMGLVAAQGAGAFVLTWRLLTDSTDAWETERMFGDFGEKENEIGVKCHGGPFYATKLIGFWVLFLVVCAVFRVWTGRVHSNTTYITSRSIVTGTKLGKEVDRLVAIMRVSFGSFIFPFLNLGIRPKSMKKMKKLMKRESWTTKDSPETWHHTENELAKRPEFKKQKTNPKRNYWIENLYMVPAERLTELFTAEARQLKDLMAIQRHEAGAQAYLAKLNQKTFGDLEVGASSMAAFYKSAKKATKMRENAGKVKQTLENVVKVPLGVYGKEEIAATHSIGRSRLWQGQLEQSQKNNAQSMTLAMQLIPFIGVPLGKMTQYLNQHPRFVSTAEPEQSCRSMRSEDTRVRPSVRLSWLYFVQVLKLVCLGVGYGMGYVLTATFAVYVIAMVEGWLDKKMTEYGIEGKVRGYERVDADDKPKEEDAPDDSDEEEEEEEDAPEPEVMAGPPEGGDAQEEEEEEEQQQRVEARDQPAPDREPRSSDESREAPAQGDAEQAAEPAPVQVAEVTVTEAPAQGDAEQTAEPAPVQVAEVTVTEAPAQGDAEQAAGPTTVAQEMDLFEEIVSI